jgi:hypothetical protein
MYQSLAQYIAGGSYKRLFNLNKTICNCSPGMRGSWRLGFVLWAPYMCGSTVWGWLHVFLMVPRILALTLSLLMSYVYGTHSKAINLTSYIYGRDFLLGILLLEPCISLMYA